MKTIRILLVILAMTISLRLPAQHLEIHLGDSAFASLITCGAGSDFYTTFGHSAIRICDSSLNLDIVYNYGTFDFNTPHFYWKFACGNLDYQLARESFGNFMFIYAYEGRSVSEQRLRLSNQELNNLFLMLEYNYLPDYRYYRYDFFNDNCATRVRDMICRSFAHSKIAAPAPTEQKTYRQLLREYTADNLPWWQTGIDMLLGQECDRPCAGTDDQFLPDRLSDYLTAAIAIDEDDGTQQRPMAMPANQMLSQSDSVAPTPTPFWRTPFAVGIYILLLTLTLTILSYLRNWRLTWFDVALFLLAGIASLLILFFWIVSSYHCTSWNLNILWASPVFLFLAIMPNAKSRIPYYLQLFLLLAALLVGIFGLQSFPSMAYPLMAALAIRLIARLTKINKQ